MPCKTGTRESIEAGKLWHRRERELDATDPFRKLWRALVHRVHDTPLGFEGLSDDERMYFAVGLLDGEVYNGGFDQYLWNSSSTYYSYAERGLMELRADECLRLLHEAVDLAFRDRRFPEDGQERRSLLQSLEGPELSQALERLDQAYWKDPDGLAERLERFARDRRLIDEAAQQGVEADEA
jgi:hypothetical protein